MNGAFGSLFSGIGGIDLGLERAGWKCAWQVEIDPFCNQVLSKHWPATPRILDVKTADKTNLVPVDLIAGGFPCQDISTANPSGRGLEGERSGLWYEFERVVRELEPTFVLVENVHRAWRRWVPQVREALGGLGFRSEAVRLRASDFGAPHERARSFVIATHVARFEGWQQPHGPICAGRKGASSDPHRASLRDESRRGSGQNGPGSHVFADDGQAGVAPDADQQRQLQPRWRIGEEWRWVGDCPGYWDAEPAVAGVVHGLPRGVVRSRRRAVEKALGNAVVPACAEWCGRRLMELANSR